MANLPETPQWEDGIYQIEVSDPVLGGPDGISNRQGKQLASRTLYLKQQVEKGGTDLAAHIAAADPHTQYAPKASPTFTGTPTAPTAANNDNSKKLATTEFVVRALAALADSAPETLDTLKELADALGNDPNFATTILNKLAEKLAKAQNGADIPDKALFLQNLGLKEARFAVVTSSMTVTIPSWVTEYYVTASAGGGGGGGAGGSVNLIGVGGGGGGGGAGEFIVRKKFTKAAGVTLDIPVTIGAAGGIGTIGTPSAPGGNGGDGGSTIIGTLQTLRGGGGGKGGDSFGGTLVPGGGVGGIGYPSGQDGQDGANGSIAGGSGGSGSNSCFGGAAGGSRSGSGGVDGKQAYGYGSGGSGGGAGYGGSGGGANGGYGAIGSQGIAIFEW